MDLVFHVHGCAALARTSDIITPYPLAASFGKG